MYIAFHWDIKKADQEGSSRRQLKKPAQEGSKHCAKLPNFMDKASRQSTWVSLPLPGIRRQRLYKVQCVLKYKVRSESRIVLHPGFQQKAQTGCILKYQCT